MDIPYSHFKTSGRDLELTLDGAPIEYPALVKEAFLNNWHASAHRTEVTSNCASLNERYCWVLSRNQMFIWERAKSSHRATIPTQLPLPTSGLPRSAKCVVVYDGVHRGANKSPSPGVLIVSPEGVLRHWTSIESQNYIEKVLDINSEVALRVELTDEPEDGKCASFLLTTTSGTVYFLNGENQDSGRTGALECHKVTGREAHGFRRRLSSIMFGGQTKESTSLVTNSFQYQSKDLLVVAVSPDVLTVYNMLTPCELWSLKTKEFFQPKVAGFFEADLKKAPSMVRARLIDAAVFRDGLMILIGGTHEESEIVHLFVAWMGPDWQTEQPTNLIWSAKIPMTDHRALFSKADESIYSNLTLCIPQNTAESKAADRTDGIIILNPSFAVSLYLPFDLHKPKKSESLYRQVSLPASDQLIGYSICKQYVYIMMLESGVSTIRLLPRRLNDLLQEMVTAGLPNTPHFQSLHRAFELFGEKEMAKASKELKGIVKMADSEMTRIIMQFLYAIIDYSDAANKTDTELLAKRVLTSRMILFLKHMRIDERVMNSPIGVNRPGVLAIRLGATMIGEVTERVAATTAIWTWKSTNETNAATFDAIIEKVLRLPEVQDIGLKDKDALFGRCGLLHHIPNVAAKQLDKKVLGKTKTHRLEVFYSVCDLLVAIKEAIILWRKTNVAIATIPAWWTLETFSTCYRDVAERIIEELREGQASDSERTRLLLYILSIYDFYLSENDTQPDNDKILQDLINLGKGPDAMELAEKHRDFGTLIKNYLTTDLIIQQNAFERYKKTFEKEDFEMYLWDYLKKNGLNDVLLQHAGERLDAYLDNFKELRYSREIVIKQFGLSFFEAEINWNSKFEMFKAVDLIRDHRNLKILDLRGNTLSVLAGKLIGEALKSRKELKECLWSDTFTGLLKKQVPLVLDSLGEALTESGCRLTTLDLSDNAFGAGLSKSLFNFLQSPALYSLESLILNNNALGLAGTTVGEALCALMESSKAAGTPLKLKKFVCGRNRLEIVSIKALSQAFKMMKSLEELRLPQNKLSELEIDVLSRSLLSNRKLRVLDINKNQCSRRGAVKLAEFLPGLHNLEILDLGDCVCDDEGVIAILSGLEGRRDRLQKVVLKENNITADIIDKIGDFFNSKGMNRVMVDVSLNEFGNDFDEAKAKHGKGNIDFGDKEDDKKWRKIKENEANDKKFDSMLLGLADFQKSLTETVTDQPIQESTAANQMLDDQNGGIVSFLDQSLKLDSAESAQQVVNVINATSSMKTLELRGNTMGIEAEAVISKALEKHSEEEKYLMSGNFAGRLKKNVRLVLESQLNSFIKAGCKIRAVDLSDNAFGPIGADALKQFLESPSAFTLETLKLNNNGLGIGGKQIAKSLSECLRKSISIGGENRLRLKYFIAGRNRLENPGAHALAATFKDLKTIELFDVRQNGIHEEGIRALVAALKHNRNLRHLWLEDNTVLPKGAKALAKALESWPKLEVLNLSDCLLRDAGCNYIIDHLNPQQHRHLKNVYLCGNELTPPTAKLIIQKWAKFDVLTPKPILHIHTNSFGDEFDEVAQMAPDNVKVGDKDDDDADMESGPDDDVDVDDVDSDDVQVLQRPNKEAQLKQALDRIDQLDIDFESRFQEDTARVILQLAAPLKACGMEKQAFQRAAEVAENIIRRMEAVETSPIPATAQLINNIVAQIAGTGVKLQAETDWGYNADPQVMESLLEELVSRGHFRLELALIQRFFRPMFPCFFLKQNGKKCGEERSSAGSLSIHVKTHTTCKQKQTQLMEKSKKESQKRRMSAVLELRAKCQIPKKD